jgi:predicted  nucleic acid-binding Zn-ribbon protein
METNMNEHAIDILEKVIKRSNSNLQELNHKKQELTQELEFTVSLISQTENELVDYLNAIKCLKQ